VIPNPAHLQLGVRVSLPASFFPAGVQSRDMSSTAAGQIAVVVVAVLWMLPPFSYTCVRIYKKAFVPESLLCA